MISGNPRAMSAAANSTRSVSSRLAPSGRSTTTAISDLLSNGSNLTVTDLVANSVIDSSVATPTPIRKIQDERLLRTIGVAKRR